MRNLACSWWSLSCTHAIDAPPTAVIRTHLDAEAPKGLAAAAGQVQAQAASKALVTMVPRDRPRHTPKHRAVRVHHCVRALCAAVRPDGLLRRKDAVSRWQMGQWGGNATVCGATASSFLVIV
jgi:hypothetical protein